VPLSGHVKAGSLIFIIPLGSTGERLMRPLSQTPRRKMQINFYLSRRRVGFMKLRLQPQLHCLCFHRAGFRFIFIIHFSACVSAREFSQRYFCILLYNYIEPFSVCFMSLSREFQCNTSSKNNEIGKSRNK